LTPEFTNGGRLGVRPKGEMDLRLWVAKLIVYKNKLYYRDCNLSERPRDAQDNQWWRMGGIRYEFDWDPAKAAANLAKHGVEFRSSMTVFLDPLARSRPEEDNSDEETRWVTLGEASNGLLVVVVHTYVETTPDRINIRIISARRPTRHEARQYREGCEP
jgi:uncharacterized DUF497 family protein